MLKIFLIISSNHKLTSKITISGILLSKIRNSGIISFYFYFYDVHRYQSALLSQGSYGPEKPAKQGI